MKIAVIGLGKLGLPMAVAIAERGIQVFGVERDPKRLRLIRKTPTLLDEPGVSARLKKLIRAKRLVLSDYAEAVTKTEASFIAVNTPEGSPGEMDTRDLESCVTELAKALRNQSKFYVIAVVSTIVPETTERKLRPILERVSGKRMGKSVGLVANPVFIALGSVIRDYLNPPVVVVGATDSRTSQWMVRFYKKICKNRPAILTTSPYTAEVIKLAHNAYCTSKMAFINEVADLCSRSPGADIRKVEEFFASGGERAGKFLKAGLGYGGPCFPRDLRLFLGYLKKKGLKPALLSSIRESNEAHAREIVKRIRSKTGLLRRKKVVVLGLNYKPGVRNFEDSFSFHLIRELNREKARVFAYDSLLEPPSLRNGLWRPLKEAPFILKRNLDEALKSADVCILAHPPSAILSLAKIKSRALRSPTLIFNPWSDSTA